MPATMEVSKDELLLALSRAIAFPAGLPLLARRNQAGLFPANAQGRRLAQYSQHAGYLTPMPGAGVKRGVELFGLSESGARFLEEAADPALLLDKLLAAVRDREAELEFLRCSLERCAQNLAVIARRVEGILPAVSAARVAVSARTGAGLGDRAELAEALKQHIRDWHAAQPSADIPLPGLYRALQRRFPALSVGQFHDELRRLHAAGAVRLQPWTGPLSELPEPALALLAGHAVMYFVSEYQALVAPSARDTFAVRG
jgi:hypothetical protein